MNCAHVCVRMLWGAAGVGTVWCLLLILYLFDEDMQEHKWHRWWMIGMALELFGIFGLYPAGQQSFITYLGFFWINVYLAVSTTMDILMKKVTDMVHYLGLLGGVLLIFQTPPHPEICKELIFFIMVQYFVFQKMYGRADVIGFVLCALFIASTGRGIATYMEHMSLTFGILALVQAFRKNIASNGNLKSSVALFPYITTGFFLII